MPMKLKMDDSGNVALVDGKVVYVDDDNREFPIDGGALFVKVRELTHENTTHRRAKEAAEAKLADFADIDAEAARRALSTVSALEQKKLVDAGEIQKVRDDAIAAVQAQFAPVVAERDRLLSDLHAEKIGGSFARSKFIADKVAIPADLVEARFGSAFKLVDGKVVAFDQSGREIYARNNPSELAGFDDALEQLVERYPQKDAILKGSVGAGGGATGSAGSSGSKVIKAAAFEALSGRERAAKIADGFVVAD